MPSDSVKQKPVAAFISYAKADQEKAQEIADSLEQRGFRCWIAPRDVKPGRSYGDEIIRGIEGARSFILVLSSASNASNFVSREIERAVSKNKPVFTVRIEDVEPAPALELFISSTQWIDAFRGRLGPQIDRLAGLLAEQEGIEPAVVPAPEQASRHRTMSRWTVPAGAAGALLVAGLAAFLLWPKGAPGPAQPSDPSLLTEPAWLKDHEAKTGEEMAAGHQAGRKFAYEMEPQDAASGAAAPSAAAKPERQAALEDGLFGPDTRQSLSEFAGAEKEKLLASYGYVGTLSQDGAPFCNATLVGPNLVLTSDYCFTGRDVSGIVFRILDHSGRPFESNLLRIVGSAPIRGTAGQSIAVASLADPLGDQVGFVKNVGGNPVIGQKLDIVAVDLKGSAGAEDTEVAGAATGDANCVVLARDGTTDTFAHRCVSPEGSGGAPIFDAATGRLLGIVGETDVKRRIGIAYRADAAAGLTRVTCTVTDPTGTPLNVRDNPNGGVVGTLTNGIPVAIVDSKTASNGKPWVKVVDPKTQAPIGWIFREFLSCS